MRFIGFTLTLVITLGFFSQCLIKAQNHKSNLLNTFSKLPETTSKKLHLKKTHLITPNKTILA